MQDKEGTKEQLLRELEALRQRVAGLEAECQHAREALQRSEERWRMYIEQANDLIFALNTEGQITSANRMAGRVFGYSIEEMLGKSPLEFVVPGDRAQAAAALRQIMSGQDVEQIEVEAITRDGNRIWLEIRGHMIRQGDRVVETFHIARDVTERKRVEAALRRSNTELQSRNEELDAFVRTVTHGLKSPLGIIIGYANMLESGCTSLSDEELQGYVGIITQNGHRMDRIIDSLLKLALVRDQEVEVEPLDMADIVTGAQLSVAHLIEEVQAEIILPATWPTALGYAPWVEEVWVNYLSNALKYGGQPPRVELGARQVVDRQTGQSMVCFWVRDDGPGLTPQERSRLFIPFTQLERIPSRGYGLGLSIVKRIVEKLGGQVGVESTLGQGSVFAFTLLAAADRS